MSTPSPAEAEKREPPSPPSPRRTTLETPTRDHAAAGNEPPTQARAPKRCISPCLTEARHMKPARITRKESTFPRFLTFQRNQMCRSLCDGLPHRHLPLPGFLTLSAAWSPHILAALFRAASAHRLAVFRAFSTRTSRSTFRYPLLSCRWAHPLRPVSGCGNTTHRQTQTNEPRLQSLTPAWRPTLQTTEVCRTKPLLS